MRPSEFPLDKTDRDLSEITLRAKQRLGVYRDAESPSAEGAASPGYDSLQDYWNILFRHRKTLLNFVLAGLLGACAISLVETPIYRVRTSLEIQGSNFAEMKGSNDSSGSYSTPESYVETQVKLLQSESLLEAVIDKMKFEERPATGWLAFASRVRHIFESSTTSRLTDREKLIREIENNLTVRTSGNSHLLEVLYESPDRQVAADLANTLVSEFVELNQEARWKSAQGTAEWLTNHLDKMKAQLEQSETQMQDYASTSGLSFTSEKENLAENRLKELQDELSKAQADRIANEAKFEAAKSKPPDSLPEILEDNARLPPKADGIAAAICRTQCNADTGTLQSAARGSADQRTKIRNAEGTQQRAATHRQRIRSRTPPRNTIVQGPDRSGEDRSGSIRESDPLRYSEARRGFEPPAVRDDAAAG
jgi:capsular polysaccharide biosynthesis protein